MYCKNCGTALDPAAAVCVNCGCPKGQGAAFCHNCAAATAPGAVVCTNCGVSLVSPVQDSAQAPAQTGQKSKMTAGLLGIFVGSFGVHNFYLGFTNKAILQIVLTIVTCGAAGLWGFIEGIMILTGSINKDANGTPLAD
ncbi:MAG: NINE protein [Acutalibacteraceae bacterium]|jgi:TM2 domain-containing membrane protein YozV